MSDSPTQRTLRKLRSDGYEAHVVEKWIAFDGHPAGGVRRDMAGFADIIAWGRGRIIAVQACSGYDVQKHLVKYRDDKKVLDSLLAWFESRGYFEIWGWRKLAEKRGGKKFWRPRVLPVTAGVLLGTEEGVFSV